MSARLGFENMEFIEIDNDKYLAYFPDTYNFFRINRLAREALVAIKQSGPDAKKRFSQNVIQRCTALLQKNMDSINNSPVEIPNRQLGRLTLNVSGGCNLRCQYCYANAGDYKTKGHNMTVAVADRALSVFFNHFEHIETIMFFGGEPLLNYPLIEYVCKKTVDMARNTRLKSLPHFAVITNGTVYNKKIAELFKKYNFSVTVSYDGDIDVNNKLRISQKGQGMSSVIIDTIHKIIDETGIIPGIEATYTRFHLEQGISPLQVVKNIKQISDKLNVHLTPVMADPVYPYALSDYSSFADSVSDFFKNIKSFSDYKQNSPVYNLLSRLLEPLIHKTKPAVRYICDAGFGMLSVAANGEVYPCFMFIDMKQFCLGNIFDADIFATECFKEKQKAIQSFSEKKTNPECRSCFARTVCSGCIGYGASDEQGLRLDKKSCDLTKNMLRNTIIGLYNMTNRTD